MVFLPVRKCYYAAKVALLIILVVTVLGLFEKWRGGKRAASAFLSAEEKEYERQIAEDEARIIPGLGEGGVAAYLSGDDWKRGEESEKKYAMNVYLSDRISYNRTLKDYRHPSCARVTYDAELPSASVILIFHNEPYSVVIRTIWSVINSCRRDQPWFSNANFVDRDGKPMKLGYPGQDPSSQLVYLKEIILVDDNSTLPELKGKMSHYVRTRLPPDLIRILRLPDREGLMRARIRGARAARGDVLVFLDAHCEAETDWLRPLLQRVRDKRDAVVTPIIDVLDQRTFRLEASETFQVGGFTFTGHFTWIDVPEREKKRRGSDIAPTWSPTMAGGLFAINRAYYWELGAYDEQMAGWGGENLEMSFRIWQCGGTLETVPCSRVGHVFRSFHPYSMPANSDTHGINTARMAEVWMDEYAELFYLHRPDLRKSPKIGDVTHRKILREKLKCKSFQWFLDNIYKEKYVPVRDAYGYGRFRNAHTNLCIDNLQREGGDAALGVYMCHGTLQASQYYTLSLLHELRNEDACAQVQYVRQEHETEGEGRRVHMTSCHGKQREQKWIYLPLTKQIQHAESKLCLDSGTESGSDLMAKACSDALTQQWIIDYTEDNDYRLTNANEIPSDQEVKLSRLRGQRRKSRSLLSIKTDERRRRKKHHKRTKKSKTKNKFILKLVRTLMNNTEDHLEVDIHCKHRQLYPNNTFVRDLVTILNERNIKVINNGRVFERNKVTQLDPKEDEERKVLNKMEIGTPDEEIQQTKKTRMRKRKPSVPSPAANEIERAFSPVTTSAREPNKARNAPEPNNAPNFNEPILPINEYNMNAHQLNADAFDRGSNKNDRVTDAFGSMSADFNTIERNESKATKSPRSHRIIIEDFIEMTPKTKHSKRRKRKRVSSPPPPAAPAAPAPAPAAAAERDDNILSLIAARLSSQVQEQISLPVQSEEQKEESMEDAPMMSESETADSMPRASERDRDTYKQQKDEKAERNRDKKVKKVKETRERDRNTRKEERHKDRSRERDGVYPNDNDNRIDKENWPIGESRFRVKESGRRRYHPQPETIEVHTDPGTHTQDTSAEAGAPGASGAPVKVVMRSNLTFNLGDEFFKWGANTNQHNDVSESELPRARGDVTTPRTSYDDDVILTGHLRGEREREREREPERERETEERSSSSDSTSGDTD